MKNVIMKRRIASLAAAVVVSVSCVSGSISVNNGVVLNNTMITANAAESSVVITASKGYQEAAYVQWSPVTNATGYNVYCDGVQIDSMLIRQ